MHPGLVVLSHISSLNTTAIMATTFFHPRRVAILLLVAVAYVYAEKHAASIASMSIPEIEDQLQARLENTPPLSKLR